MLFEIYHLQCSRTLITYTDHVHCSFTLQKGAAIHWSAPMKITLINAVTWLGLSLNDALCERTFRVPTPSAGFFQAPMTRFSNMIMKLCHANKSVAPLLRRVMTIELLCHLRWLRYVVVEWLSHITDSYLVRPQVRRTGGQHHMMDFFCVAFAHDDESVLDHCTTMLGDALI